MELGPSGVSIFFVLSGFLITNLLIKEESDYGNIDLKLFFFRRAFRLFPALWLYLTIIAIGVYFGYLPDSGWHSISGAFLYVRNIVGRGHETGHLWSLSLEEQFYFCWPLALILTRNRTRLRILIATLPVVTSPLWRHIAELHSFVPNGGTTYMRTDFRLDSPAFGCCLALAKNSKSALLLHIFASPKWSHRLFCTAFIGLATWHILRAYQFSVGGFDYSIASIFAFFLIASQICRPSVRHLQFDRQAMVFLGQISYGLYIWQQLFLGPSTPLLPFRSNLILALCLLGVLTMVSYYLIEKPFVKFKDIHFHRTKI